MKLAPVTEWFVRDRHRLTVVATGITRERLGICVRKGDTVLRDAIGNAQRADGGWHAARADNQWLGRAWRRRGEAMWGSFRPLAP